MRYRYMLQILLKATEEELDHDITIYSRGQDEFFPVLADSISGEEKNCPADGILDDGCLFLEID